MAALWNRADHCVFTLWFLSSSSFCFFFHCLFSAVRDWMSTILLHMVWCGLNANLECRSEMCCTRLTGNTERKNDPKNLRTIAQICRAVSSQLRHTSTIGKSVKQQYVIHMPPQYGELRPTISSDRFGNLGHPSKFRRVSRLAFVMQRRRSPHAGQLNFARCLAVSWAGTLYIHFRGLLPRQNFARCKIHFTSKSCVRLYWQRYYTALQQWASYKEWNYGTFVDCATYIRRGGHHVGHWPTF